ncbi:cation:proton antiporter [Sulfuriflexus sp.]|uniref:cation:proton antiporter domain-containing protein n=1 Tax=Sulfuriflexus sp. TaxID=2015443 RepID=UPI0028CC56D7|nr:cation:proton antiporter [Sulfuriflexus sp.]MDT8405146.1 cation:proton antiporter [Sulfuriflexus sp.]
MLNTTLILLTASLLSAALVRALGLSPIIGFLLAGVIIGPHGLSLVPDLPTIHQIAQFGIIFLMFTIGLEFSLSRLLADRFMVLVLGGLQVLFTASMFALLAGYAGIPLLAAITVGVALAMSSTAIVSRLLIEDGEVNSIYGRTAICILLFQDLATIVFLLIMPVITSGSLLSQATSVTEALALGVAVFFILLFVGRMGIRPLLRYIARLHSPEIFMLAILVVSVGAAQFAHVMGLSLALGGFMAGMVVGETEFKHQVEADIRPFQDVLLGLFFITVGMLVNLEIFRQIWPAVVVVTTGLILMKAMLVFVLIKTTGAAAVTAIRTGIALGHAGEFSLVILFLALQMGMLQGESSQVILAAVLLSMAIAPLLIRYSAIMTEGFAGVGLRQSQQAVANNVEAAARDLSSHVILCGYGRVGQNIAWYLTEEKVEYVAFDIDINRFRQPAERGERVLYGDASRRPILVAAGLERAQVVVIAFDDFRAALRTLGHVHELRPDIITIVRATDEQHLDELLDAGATEVIPDTLETSLTMAAHVLTMLGVPVAKVAERSDRIRADRYRLLRGVFHGRKRMHRRAQLRVITIPDNAFAVGRTLKELHLSTCGVNVTAIRRHGIRGADPHAQMRIQERDALIMHGSPEDMLRAEQYLIKGGPV